ncbi:hypothetical protein KAR91_31815 [Candidatus Pacearchaeota archaeon]|nr:hypothetical protein [Candidatus Pacearchaeota archaeon]
MSKHTGSINPPQFIYKGLRCLLKSCGKEFIPKAWNQRYCSKDCQREVGKQAYRAGKKKTGKMHVGKLKNSPPMRRVLALLKKKHQTTLEIQIKARVCNPATWVSALRHNGFNITCEYMGKDEKSGARVYRYQLIKGKK